MTRAFFLHLSQQRKLRSWMETSSLARNLTRRFVAGETIDDGVNVCRKLNQEKILATLDHLGENVSSEAEAAQSRDAYLAALDQISKAALQSTVSIKLTQFGLDLSTDLCRSNVRALAQRAREQNNRVEIDMESTEYTGRTLEIVRDMHRESGNVRAVIQAYLHRSAADIESLNAAGIPVRLCKGAYDEPEAVAIPDKAGVDRNYVTLMRTLLEHGTYPAIATHDEAMIAECLRFVREKNIAADRFEFQMLYGIRRDLQSKLVKDGYRMRLYVPYGTAWYPYFMRRLAERPANVLFLVRNLFR